MMDTENVATSEAIIEGEPLEPQELEAAMPGEAEMGVLAVADQELPLQPLQGLPGGAPGDDEDLSLVLDVPVELTVEMGRTTMTIRDALAIGIGSTITLNRVVGEPVDLFANGRLIARGEVIAIDEEYGLRVTEVLNIEARKAA